MKILIMTASFLAMSNVFAQDLIILDEGRNTQQSLRIPNNQLRDPGCISIQTQRATDSATGVSRFVSGSFCNPETDSFSFGPNVTDYRNSRTYNFFASDGTLNSSFNVRLEGLFGPSGNKQRRGHHGNLVSNAAYDFDQTINHRLWQVYGIERRVGTTDRWVSVTIPRESGFTQAGETVQVALDQIGINADDPIFPSSVQKNLGAVVLSLGLNAGGLTNLRCGAGDGQATVNLLRSRGIAVVVALLNTDLPPSSQSWPACLQDVILVAGDTVSSNTGSRQAGVGANRGIDFFAKDSSSGAVGNSFAAPRVAAAYAKLHELFPRSSVGQKTEALIDASDLMDSYRTRDINGGFRIISARKLRPSHMARAISNLTLLQPSPQDDSGVDLNIVDNKEHGTFFDPADTQPYGVVVNFDAIQPATSLVANVESAAVAGTRVLSPRKDIELKFTGTFRGGNSGVNFFRLMINNQMDRFITTFFSDSPSSRTIIINRNLLREGENEILLDVPSQAVWGVSNVSVKFLPSIPLTVGTTNTTVYGYEQNPTRFTGLRANFKLPEAPTTNYSLSAQGFDMDISDESSVFLNGRFLGTLNSGSSSAFSTPKRFFLTPDMLSVGRNFVEFVQRRPQVGVWEGFEDEKWAVKNINISPIITPDVPFIVPIIFQILDDD